MYINIKKNSNGEVKESLSKCYFIVYFNMYVRRMGTLNPRSRVQGVPRFVHFKDPSQQAL